VPLLAFLHTAEVHVETFDGLVAHAAPDVDVIHVVAPDLLSAARRRGLTDPEVRSAVEGAIAELEVHQPDVIVCTCSTISGLAEEAATSDGAAVIRVDRPLATHIVTTAERVALLATVESTLIPTLELFEDERERRGGDTELATKVVDGAWERFEAGDLDGYHRLIADAADALDGSWDAVVLSQASMAPARDLVTDPMRVHSSPVLAVEAALDAL